METIEILVYFGIAVICGALVLNFIYDAPIEDIGKDVEDKLRDKKNFDFKQVDELGFYELVIDFWKEHQHSDAKASTTVYYIDEGTLDKKEFFDKIKENNLCGSLQSKAFDCGTREDIKLGTIDLPRIIKIVYENDTISIASNVRTFTSNSTAYVSNLYFGGFEGNGRITKSINIPGAVSQMKLRTISGADFDLYFNDQLCNDSFLTTDQIDSWDISSCSHLVADGDNEISMDFRTPDLFRKYIAGGYLTIVHESEPSDTITELPLIDGTINYFSSFDTSGNQPVQINLDYWVGFLNGTDIYVAVGDDIIYQDSVSDHDWSGTVTVPTTSLRSGMNPIKIGVNSAQSTSKTIDIPIPVDVVLITDVSGSMEWNLSVPYGQNIPPGVRKDCTHPTLYDGDTEKLSLAKCFGKEFVDIVLSKYRQNRVGLVSFSNEVTTWFNVTSNQASLELQIEQYEPLEATCVSCAIERAREILADSPREKAMVIMTDGVANACIGQGFCGEGPAQDEARAQGQLAADEGISLYTIAFGDGADSTILRDIAAFDNITHFGQGTNSTEIQAIYHDFANSIAQSHAIKTKHVQGARDEHEVPSILRGISIDTVVPATTGNKVMVRKDIGCPGIFDLPDQTISSAHLLSWAGTLWTQSVELNNNYIFDLNSYSSVYLFIGDPFIINLPVAMLENHNTITPTFSDVEKENVVCGESTIQYVMDVPDNSFTHAMGCHWLVQFPQNRKEFTIPPDYIGDRYCEYTPDNIKFEGDDVFQYSVGTLFTGLDYNNDGRVDDTLDEIYVIGGLS